MFCLLTSKQKALLKQLNTDGFQAYRQQYHDSPAYVLTKKVSNLTQVLRK